MNEVVPTPADERRATILAVDDDPNNLRIISQHLEGAGYKVLVARDGESGLQKARYAQPDLILLDLMMPRVDGFQTCRRLKADPELRETPVIFMTALGEPAAKVEAFQAGAVDYITKPAQYEEVLARVQTHLSLHTMRRRLQEQNARLHEEIVERQHAELALRGARDELERRVAERTDELARANENLRSEVAQRLRTELEVRRVNRMLRLLSEVNQIIVHATEESALLPELCRLLTQQGGYVQAAIYFGEAAEAERAPPAFASAQTSDPALLELTAANPASRQLIAAAERHATPTIAHRVADDPAWAELAGRGVAAAIALPLLRAGGGEPLGALHLLARDADAFSADEVELLRELAGDLAFGVTALRSRAERARTEDALRRSQQLLQAVIDNSTTIITIKDTAGRFLLVNQRFAELFHVDARTIAGRTDFDVFSRERAEAFQKFDQQVIAAERALEAEEIAPHDDGPHTYISVKCPLRSAAGEIYAVCGISTDITDWKRAQQEREDLLGKLEVERARLGEILDLTPIPLLLLEPGSARVVFANKASRAATGGVCPGEHAESGSCTDGYGELIAGDELPHYRAARGEKLVDFELVWRSPAGPRSLLINSETLRAADGRAELVVLALQDMTRLKQVEEQLRQSQKMEVIGQLAGGIAHDFNNLLTAILGYTDLLLHQPELTEPTVSFLHEIRTSGQRAGALTRQLLAFSRKQILQPKVIDLNALVGRMEKMLRRLIGEDIQLELALDPALRAIRADPGQIEQVILNLSVNARDAMPRGGRLWLTTANVVLTAPFPGAPAPVPPGEYVRVTVRDSGCGMSAEVRRHVFEPFFTTKGVGKGTGLGLSTVYGVVAQSNGHITFHSEVDRGSTFEIFLPALAEPAPPADSGALAPELTRGHETILLVEDNAQVRHMTRQVLQRAGYSVIEARHGGEALHIIEQRLRVVDLMLTDVVMPEMSGPVLAERAAQIDPELRVIYMSGYIDEAMARHGIEEGRVLVEKPFTPDEILRKVREALDLPAK